MIAVSVVMHILCGVNSLYHLCPMIFTLKPVTHKLAPICVRSVIGFTAPLYGDPTAFVLLKR